MKHSTTVPTSIPSADQLMTTYLKAQDLSRRYAAVEGSYLAHSQGIKHNVDPISHILFDESAWGEVVSSCNECEQSPLDLQRSADRGQ